MPAYYSDMVDRSTCLYRFFDMEGNLLYVGITMDLERRLEKHRRREWWPVVAATTVEWFTGREAAKRAEAQAIRDEDPAHNVARPKVA